VDAARLSRLWPGAGLDLAGAWRPGDAADALRHQLAAPLDAAAPAGPAGPPPRTYADLLMRDTDPPAEQLRRVKDWAKPFMSRDDGEVPREVAGVLYFAAILAARLRRQRISGLPDDRLRQAALWALRLPWLDPGLAVVFQGAAALLGPTDSAEV